MTFQVGYRVLVNVSEVPAWEKAGMGPMATVVRSDRDSNGPAGLYGIRLDNYDYRLNDYPTNCHNASANLLSDPGISDDEEKATLASIERAIRGE